MVVTLRSWKEFVVSAIRNVARLLGGSVHDPALLKQLYRSAGQRINSDQTAYGLRRDLDVPTPLPRP